MTEDDGSILEKTARGAGWVVAWRMITRTLGLLSTLVLVRLLAPADFGLIALASSFSVSIEAFSWIGIEEGVIRHKAPSPALLDTAFTLSILRGAVVFLIIVAAAYPASRFFGEPRLLAVLIALGATVFIENFINVGTIEFRRDFSFHREFQLYLLPRILSILIGIGSAAVLHTYWALIAAIVSNQVLRVAFSYTMHPYRPRLRLSAWREMASYSAWNSVIAGAGALRDRVDTMMVGRAMSPAAVGFYALGYEIAGLPVTELISPLTRAAFAGFAAAWREQVAAGETWLRLVSSMALVTFPAGVGASAVAQPLIALAFGPGWEQAVPVMQVLGIPLCLTVFGMVGQTLFLAQGHMATSLAITAGATLVRLALLAALIPRFGLLGAALAAGVGIAVEQGLSGLWAMRRLHLSLPRDLLPQIWRCVLATAGMAAVLWATGLGWREMATPFLIAAVALGAATYGAALAGLWILAGRPAGPEMDLLALTGRLLRRKGAA
jgi:lipopolysaccharide exporter